MRILTRAQTFQRPVGGNISLPCSVINTGTGTLLQGICCEYSTTLFNLPVFGRKTEQKSILPFLQCQATFITQQNIPPLARLLQLSSLVLCPFSYASFRRHKFLSGFFSNCIYTHYTQILFIFFPFSPYFLC